MSDFDITRDALESARHAAASRADFGFGGIHDPEATLVGVGELIDVACGWLENGEPDDVRDALELLGYVSADVIRLLDPPQERGGG